MQRRILSLLIAASMLSACANGGPPIAVPEYQIPAHLAKLGPEQLPDPASNQPDDLTQNHVITAGLYHEMRKRYTGLLQWLSTKRITARELR